MKTTDSVLSLLLDAQDYLSGQQIADELDISRNAVWKAVSKLIESGFKIESKTKVGYRLQKNGAPLTKEIIVPKIPKGYDIQIFETIGSTNSYLKEIAANGAADKTICIATEQTAGRGRMGRSFLSPKNTGLYISFLYRPDFTTVDATLLTTAAAVAFARAIKSVCKKDVMIKWINDIYLDGKKVCGILTEAVSDIESGRVQSVIIGGGINIAPPKEGFGELSNIATSLFERAEECDKNALATALINEMDRVVFDVQNPDIIKYYREKSLVIGKEITVIGHKEIKSAIAVDIDDSGHLIVEKDDKRYELQYGEISIRADFN